MIDASTGQAWATTHQGDGRWASIHDEVLRWSPSELVLTLSDSKVDEVLHLISLLDSIIISQHAAPAKRSLEKLKRMLSVNDLGHLDLDDSPLAL